MQTALSLLYPPQCVNCGAQVESDFGLCGTCWRETPFIDGLVCDSCGRPLPGEEDADERVLCDDCMRLDPPWDHGRAALVYRDNAQSVVLALKHGDRTDLVRPAAGWMARALRPVLPENPVVVPIPSHWIRLLQRRYNQAAELARVLAGREGYEFVPDALIRPRRTCSQEGLSAEERFANMEGALKPHPRRARVLRGRDVILVDDVMTTGATFTAATHACHAAGVNKVVILSLARVAKDA